MTASQMRIAETIDAFYGDAGANDGVSRSYKQAVEDLDAETIKALDGPFRYLVFTIDQRLLKSRFVFLPDCLLIERIGKPFSSPSHASATTFRISTNVNNLFTLLCP